MTLTIERAVLYLQALSQLHHNESRRTRKIKYRLWSLLETSAQVRELLNRPVNRQLYEMAHTYTPEQLQDAAAQLKASLYQPSGKPETEAVYAQ